MQNVMAPAAQPQVIADVMLPASAALEVVDFQLPPAV
jgi:hypothetical protein